ncbi:hypothetical protein [Glycomyces buryatensis]|uniref:Uncharacterized protein n=1 Tax=Glycomyces buryatensis TaxID=2570927 RepID=A0A4S8Q015_9ACTN|nr:hypothetical protein [Glycomyces buryatensis]THV35692.1 hypothetical protein FAB82_22720 [Glycomyces buryatensis]
MKVLDTFKLGDTEYKLVQAEMNGRMASPTSISILAPMKRLDGDQIVGTVLRLHTDAPEWMPLDLQGVPEAVHASEFRAQIITEAVRVWRERYDRADYAEANEVVSEDEKPSRPAWSRALASEAFLSFAAVATAIGLFLVASWLADGFAKTVIVYALLLFSFGVVAVAVALPIKVYRSVKRSADPTVTAEQRSQTP